MPVISQPTHLTPDDRAAVVAPLDAFSRSQGYVWQPQSLTLLLHRDDGSVAGGLLGQCHWEWLRIEILAVAEDLRGQGWGRQLLEHAERLALVSGCHHSWVDTFSFQARPFYERLGYVVFGQLPDYPSGQTRYFLAKVLHQGETLPT